MARGRKRLMLGWGLIGLGTMAASLVVASRWWFFGINLSQRWHAGFLNGQLSVLPLGRDDPSLFPMGRTPERRLVWVLEAVPQTPDQRAEWDLGVFQFVRWPSRPRIWQANVLPYPAVIALLVTGWFMQRRGARARRNSKPGLCPACGYDRSTLPTAISCPECNAPTPIPPKA